MLKRYPRSSVRVSMRVAAVWAVCGAAVGLACAQAPVETRGAAAIDEAASLLASGKPLHARAVLNRLSTDAGSVGLTDAQRERALDLMQQAKRASQRLTPARASLDRAEIALGENDLRSAERHVRTVLTSTTAQAQETSEATALSERISSARAAFEPKAAEVLRAALAELEAGNIPAAKRGLDRVFRSGVALSAESERSLDEGMIRVVEAERLGVGVDADQASAAMLQPGVIRPAQEPSPEPAPVPFEPASQPVAQGSPPPAPFVPPPAPEFQPAPAPAPAGDPLTTARQIEAQALFAESNRAFDENRMSEALTGYQRLKDALFDQLTPDQQRRVDERIAEARLKLRGAGQVNLLGETIQRDTLARQQTLAEFRNELNQARDLLGKGDPDGAMQRITRANLILNNGRSAFSETDFRQLQNESQTLRGEVESSRDALQRSQREKQEAEQRSAAEAARQARESDKERKIRENIDRVVALMRELRYEEALQVNEQILFLDPVNPAGLLLRDSIEISLASVRQNRIFRDRARSYSREATENQAAMVLPRTPIEYSPDWPSISFRRGEPLPYSETPANRSVLGVLENKRIPAEFEDDTLAQALEYVRGVAGVNVDVNWRSLASIGVEKDALVSLNLTNVPIRSALDRLLEKVSPDSENRAGWAVIDGILVIASQDDLDRQDMPAHAYDIRDLLVDAPNYTDTVNFDLESVLAQSRRTPLGESSPFDERAEGEGGARGPTADEKTRQIISLIQQQVDPEGWSDVGGARGFMQPLSGSLLVTTTPRNHRAITGLLQRLREVRNLQINVEARFLLVSQDFFERIGFDLDVYFNAENNQVRFAQGNDPSVQVNDFFDFSGQRGRGLLRQVQGQGPTLGQTGPITNDDRITQATVPPSRWSPIGVGQNSSSLTSALLPNSGIAGALAGASPALGIAGQFLDDVQVDFLIEATQADRRSVQLTAPRLTFTNGQVANIIVATQVAFVSDLEPVVSESAVGFDPTVASIPEGVRLVIEGFVTADRRYVTMNVDTSIGQIQGFEDRAVTAVAGGQLVNSADTESFIQLPTVTTTRVQTTVTIPDQGTILLGGQRLMSETEVETGVPVLSKIPILNRFFSNRAINKEEQTLFILMKPTILIQNEEEEKNFPGLMDGLRSPLGG